MEDVDALLLEARRRYEVQRRGDNTLSPTQLPAWDELGAERRAALRALVEEEKRMSHPAKPALRSIHQPYDTDQFHPPITQAFGNVLAMEPAVFSYGDGVYGWLWEPGCTQNNTHTGIDYGLAGGTPLLAVAAGTVLACTPPAQSYGFGNLTILDHGGGLLSFYAHQREFDCVPGQSVRQGQQIGRVGTTGNSTGDHLHFATGSPDGSGYYVFYDPTPYLLYGVPAEKQYPTAGKYRVLVDMFLRTEPKTDASHGALVRKGDILEAQKGWTSHWRYCRASKGDEGWAYAVNLSAA
jgi:murein DD-endopeptidase MepM/ murein hydrolase activator NlpD